MPGDEPVGPHEPRDQGLLSSAVARPFQSAFGEDRHKTTIRKAAALFHSLIANHPFHNGNKRTAIIAMNLFLEANGWFLMLSHADMYILAKETASYRERSISHEDMYSHIFQKLKNHTISYRGLKKMAGTAELCKDILGVRRLVRSHLRNREQPGKE